MAKESNNKKKNGSKNKGSKMALNKVHSKKPGGAVRRGSSAGKMASSANKKTSAVSPKRAGSSFSKVTSRQPSTAQPKETLETAAAATSVAPSATILFPLQPMYQQPQPMGLNVLSQLEDLAVVQEIDFLEAFTGWESKNRYSIKNVAGQNILYAVEEADMLLMNTMGASRPFDITILDAFSIPILRIHRPYTCKCPLFGCMDHVEVSTGAGEPIGTILEECRCWIQFAIKTADGQVAMRLTASPCAIQLMDIEFQLKTLEDAKVGFITRKFPGFLQQVATYADVFAVHFPADLAVNIKAIVLACTFLIDFKYFEKEAQDTNL